MTPHDLRYAKTHEWVRLENDSQGAAIATVGITAFALEALTDLVYIELPQVGGRVTAGSGFGEVESVKAVSELYSPVTGEIVAVHGEISDHLENLGADPYGEGWLLKVKLDEGTLPADLMDHVAYDKQCAEEGH